MNQNLPNTSLSDSRRRALAQSAVGSSVNRIAFASKLRAGNMPHHDTKNRGSALVNAHSQSDMTKISQEQQIRQIDNQNAIELMPEIEWACRVLISSILSPKDMTKRELTYSLKMEWLPPDIRQLISDKIKEEMELNYDYANSLYPIIKDALFIKGSHPRLVLPEAAVDRIINSGHTLSIEHLKSSFAESGTSLKSGGYFGPLFKNKGGKLTMESFKRAMGNRTEADMLDEEPIMFEVIKTGPDGKEEEGIEKLDLITITDNIDALKLPAYMEAIMATKRHELMKRPSSDWDGFDFGLPTPTQEDLKVTTEGNFIDDSIGAPTVGGASPHVPGSSKQLYGVVNQKAHVSKLDEDQFRATLYKAAPTNIVTHLRIPGVSALPRRSVGRPLVQSLPSESVIPIHAPGDPSRHLGYIILNDETGHPITLANSEQTIARASALFNATNNTNAVGGQNMGSMILSKAARNLGSNGKVTKMQELTKIFEQIIDENVIGRMMNGAYPGGASIGDVNDLYSLMMARTLCSMRTRIVFVPAEMISYFAFDFHDNGVGRSLLDRNKMLIGMRAGLLLTRTTSEMRNSIPLTEVTMRFDETDPDWEKTAEEALHIMSQTRQPQYPLTTLAVNDIMDWIHRAGFVFRFAEHPRIPDTGFEFNKIQHENKLPDSEFYDKLGQQLYMGFGIPPELMDTTYDPEFAVAVANRNIIFTQTILEYQKTLSGLMSDDIRRLATSDGLLVQEIADIIKSKWGAIAANIPDEEKEIFKFNPKNYAMELVNRAINSLYVSLPSPDTTTIENQATQFDLYEQFLDRALNYIVSEDILSVDYGKELIGKISTMRPAIKAAYMRDYMARNNILPELADISSLSEDGKPVFNLLSVTKNHIQGLAVNLINFAKEMIPLDNAVAEDAKTLNLGDEGDTGGFGGGGSGGGGGGDEFGGGDMGFGGMDLNMDFGGGEGGGDENTDTNLNPET